jgi:3-hydroxyacyl-[acyl-carrier-protein] dehydratase
MSESTGNIGSLDIHEILDHLPHRYPFLLVDRVVSLTPGQSIHAYKNVSYNEPFFTGHFPHHPVMPGVLIMEALAQAAGILSFKTMGEMPSDDSVFYFVGIDNCRFKKPVMPGDQLNLHITIERNMRGIWKYKAEAKVDGAVVAEANLMCAKRDL